MNYICHESVYGIMKIRLFPQKSKFWLDEALFKELFEQYWERLFRFCYMHVKNDEHCREIVQDIFLSLWERRENLTIKESIAAYLFGAARLKIARYYRDLSQNSHMPLPSDQAILSDETQEYIHFKDLNKALNQLIEKLPPRCREVYVLSREEGLKIPDIALKLQLSEKTVEAHLTKALKFIKVHLQSS